VCRGAGIGALPIAPLGPDAEHPIQSCINLAVGDSDVARFRARGGVLPFWQGGENAAFRALGSFDPPRDLAAPVPAEARERLSDRIRPVPLAPVRRAEPVEQYPCGIVKEHRLVRSFGRHRQIERSCQSARGRHDEARRMDEGEQFEQVHPRQFGIAEAARGDSRIEQQMRRVRRAPDRFPTRYRGGIDPESGMGRDERGGRTIRGHKHLYRGNGDRTTVVVTTASG
jgi:hypothetical protein